jgi:cell volume regulation protein A
VDFSGWRASPIGADNRSAPERQRRTGEGSVAFSDHLILIGAVLVLLSVFASFVSARFGAPLLLVFLVLGMLAGEDGPGGIPFNNFQAAYLIGSLALALILFDGGLRTRRESFRVARWPALLLATLGVLVTAAVTGLATVWVTGLGPLESFLLGAIVASTDAAAVFLLLRTSGLALQRRVGATLEIESGINDPMAVFLCLLTVELLLGQQPGAPWSLAARFALQIGGGAVIGLAGGYAVLGLINRLEIAGGLYAILTSSIALAVFAGAQQIGASGFLAIYLVGLVLGNHRHRAAQLIDRFHDGLAWLSQIVMFLILGLLVTPSGLLPRLPAALLVAAVLMLVARPAAVLLCLAPFRFNRRELIFVSWVGLRGAVPIFLATMPVLAGLPGARFYFDVAFVVVLISLVCQGWTVALAARSLDLDLPAEAAPAARTAIDIPLAVDRDIAGYRVGRQSPALDHDLADLPLAPGARIVGVLRGDTALDRGAVARLQAGDYVLTVAPPEVTHSLDRLFAARTPVDTEVFGEFSFTGDVAAQALADAYGLRLSEAERALSLDALLRARLGRQPVVGDRVRLAGIELVVRDLAEDRIARVGVELDPGARHRRGLAALPALLGALAGRLGRRP